MWLLIALCTVSALFSALSVWCALMAHRAFAAAVECEARLLTQRARIDAIEEAQERLLGMHRKLAGRIYADEYHGNLPPPRNAAPRLVPSADICENYQRAQIDGPRSDAARCECNYCVAMRAERDAFRAQAVPKHLAGAKVNGVPSD